VTHLAVFPSLMFNMVQRGGGGGGGGGLYHMAKLVLHKAALCTLDLVMKILKFG